MVQQNAIRNMRIGDDAISRGEEIMPRIPPNIPLPRRDPEFRDARLRRPAPGHHHSETGPAPLGIRSSLLRIEHHAMPVNARQTRRKLLQAGADRPTPVSPTRLAAPHMMRVHGKDEGYALDRLLPAEPTGG